MITALYRRGAWLCFTPPAVLLGASLSAVGLVLFVWELIRAAHDPLRFGGSYTAGLLMLLALWWLAISLHELGHAVATKHFGGEVSRGGVMIYYGMPAFFTDTTDIWMQPRRARLIVSAAGIATMWGLGGLAMLYVVLQHDSPLAPIAFQIALVAFISNSLQLMPLLELDGYYLLVDLLEMPLLRARAFAFVPERAVGEAEESRAARPGGAHLRDLRHAGAGLLRPDARRRDRLLAAALPAPAARRLDQRGGGRRACSWAWCSSPLAGRWSSASGSSWGNCWGPCGRDSRGSATAAWPRAPWRAWTRGSSWASCAS